MRLEHEEPWGILSLKHAAVLARLGAFGRNGLFFHPEHGSLLRLAAVVTNAKLPGDPFIGEACPAGAFQNGLFKKAICMAHSIRHAIYPLALREGLGLSVKEMKKNINN